jgi:uncharacterized protein YbbK (DUF523 family)
MEFDRCRYDGQKILSGPVRELKGRVDFLPVCPEVEIGLGVPRDPLRIVLMDGEHRLIQPATGRDLTEEMAAFARTFLDSLGEVDGFILKSRSPSCAIRDAKVFSSINDEEPSARGAGLFSRAVRERFPHLPMEDEEGLEDAEGRDRFLASLGE